MALTDRMLVYFMSLVFLGGVLTGSTLCIRKAKETCVWESNAQPKFWGDWNFVTVLSGLVLLMLVGFGVWYQRKSSPAV